MSADDAPPKLAWRIPRSRFLSSTLVRRHQVSPTEQAPSRPPARIVILGGGVAGLATTRHLDRQFARQPDVEITLVSRDNYYLLPPLLFEACSGVLELRHCSQPIRPCLRRARFVEATVERVDVERQIVRIVGREGQGRELSYDHVIVALGAATNMTLIPGSEYARTFKTVADAIHLRNHVIERLERADVETDQRRRRQLLTIVVIGGGLVGVELLGELTALVDDELRYYPNIRADEFRYHLFEAGPRLLHESTAFLGEYATRVLLRRRAALHTSTRVQAIEPGVVRWPDGVVEADTIILAAGIVPSPVAASTAVERDRRGRIVTDQAMRSVSHPNVWALGDCAAVPRPDGKPYPALAQHAIREGRAVAQNIGAVLNRRDPKAFIYRALGSMAAFGHTRAAVGVRGIKLTGFLAWWMRRTYYLFQMPRWDTRVRIALDWTVSLFFRPDITKVNLAPEHEQERSLGGDSTAGSTRRAAGDSTSSQLWSPHATLGSSEGRRFRMKGIALLLAPVVALACVLAARVPTPTTVDEAAAAIAASKLPPGYRDWRLVSVAREQGDLDDIRAVLGNDVAIKAYREGTRPFPDGAIIARLAWSYDASEENNKAFGRRQSFVAGRPKNGVQFMVKDFTKYASTGGWGYSHFDDGTAVTDEAMLHSCFTCHALIHDRDYVFTDYAP